MHFSQETSQSVLLGQGIYLPVIKLIDTSFQIVGEIAQTLELYGGKVDCNILYGG